MNKVQDGVKKPLILFYDLESLPLQAYVWNCGENHIRHQQLLPNKNMWELICITYCWNDDPVQIIKWTPEGGTEQMMKEFDLLLEKADHTIGKNSDRFDVKILNAHRMLQGLPGNPSWSKYADDLEKQMRRYFRLPSQSLDYISSQLGVGGKVKMELQDWIDIDRYFDVQKLLQDKRLDEISINAVCNNQYRTSIDHILKVGKKAMDKMCFYGKKDTCDTRTLWNKLKKHFEPKLNLATLYNSATDIACRHCNGNNLIKWGTKASGKTLWQTYQCKDCMCYAGRTPIKMTSKTRLS